MSACHATYPITTSVHLVEAEYDFLTVYFLKFTPLLKNIYGGCSSGASKKGAGAEVVDVEDLLVVPSAFGKKGKGIAGDVGQGTKTPDGVVDVEYMLIVLAHFGKKW
eukprot:COSAG01_NODE_2137_length_8329_cov_52.487242_11_plen_107_part_00